MKQLQIEGLGNRETVRANAQRGEDIIKIPLNKVEVRKGFNVRFEFGDIEQLAKSILENGQVLPGRVDVLIDGTFLLTDGHRRFKALQYLQSLGQDPLFKAVVNDRKTTEEQRIIQMFTTQDSKHLEPLEVSELIRRLGNLGHNQVAIAGKIGKSTAYVSQMVALSNETVTVKKAISEGNLSVTEAAKIKRAIPSNEARDEKIKSAPAGKIKAEDITGENTRTKKIIKLANSIVARFRIDKAQLIELLEDNY